MPAPELSYALSAVGLAALLIALPTIVRAASPRFRKVLVTATAVTPALTLLAGAMWVVLTASPAHLEAATDGRWPAERMVAQASSPFQDAVVLAD
ncbi:MAG: hypothetical protein AAF297_11235 [Planctomycetota bacterium]